MEEKKLLELHAIVSGTVQGVGFRATTRHIAVSLGLTGSVRNLPDGTVEIHAQGIQETLDKFIKNLQDHFGSYIESIKIQYRETNCCYKTYTILA
jgi:acylphosphatase